MSWSREEEEELQRLAREHLSPAKQEVINQLYKKHNGQSGGDDDDDDKCDKERERENPCWCLANLVGGQVTRTDMLELVFVWQVSAYQFFPKSTVPSLPSKDCFERIARERLVGEVPAHTLARVGISPSRDSFFRRAYRLAWCKHGTTLKRIARTPYEELGPFHRMIKFRWESGVAGMFRAAPVKSEVVTELLETPLLKNKGFLEAKLWHFIILFRRRFSSG